MYLRNGVDDDEIDLNLSLIILRIERTGSASWYSIKIYERSFERHWSTGN